MTGLAILGYGVVSAAGVGRVGAAAVDMASRFEDPLPANPAYAWADFDVREQLGRKGTSAMDRATALAVVASGEALRHGDVRIDERTGPRTGLVAGTTLGSFRSTSDYSRATLVQEKPYLVNPMLFPNTVMNCAAGQSAIRHGLRGVNATVAGGPLAFHQALRYARNALASGYADTMLAGSVEEFSPHRAWNVRIRAGEGVPVGEGAAFFVLRRSSPDEPAPAEIAGIATGFAGRGNADAALAGCVRRALSAAGQAPDGVTVVVGADEDDCAAVVRVLGGTPERLAVQPVLGVCDAAAGALGLAAALPRLAGGTAVLTARSDRGGVAAAVIRGAR